MNTRIQELVKQSGIELYGLGRDRAKWEHAVNKFTELLVKDTLDVARAGIEYGNGMEDAVCRYFEVEL